MNPELLYILKVNIALGVFYIFYLLFLQKDTFYLWKRYYFLASLPLSFLFPLVDFSMFFSAVQVQTIQQITPHFPINVSGAEKTFSIQDGILYTVATGCLILLSRTVIQLISLWGIHRKSTPEEDFNNCKVRKMQTITNPFSFFQTIYINPALHNNEDMKAILNHEQIHVTQWHSVDIMLFETICALCWYNPLVWLLKRAVRQNIEFYTDKQILEAGYDRRQYQQELLKVSQIPTYLEIANNFNFNHLKKRITMMNKKNSNKMQLLKFALIVPLFAGMTVLANSDVTLGNQDKQKVTIEVKDAKQISFNETTHDFKTIKAKDGKVTAVFTLTNNNDKPIVITNVKPSCGCTTPEWTKEPISSGKQGHVKADFNPAGQAPGAFEKTITVETSGEPSTITLKIKGVIDIN